MKRSNSCTHTKLIIILFYCNGVLSFASSFIACNSAFHCNLGPSNTVCWLLTGKFYCNSYTVIVLIESTQLTVAKHGEGSERGEGGSCFYD